MNVEIKSFPDRQTGLVDRVLEVIAATDTGSRVLISSFDHSDVVAANGRAREHALGILTATPLYLIQDYAGKMVGAETVHVSSKVLGSESIAYRRNRLARSLDVQLLRAFRRMGYLCSSTRSIASEPAAWPTTSPKWMWTDSLPTIRKE